jgi:hypothetical protein
MRAKTQTHVEYEVFKSIMDSDYLAEIVADLKMDLVPPKDKVAEKRFDEGVKGAAKLIMNLMERRIHRLPADHPDYQVKV